MWKLLSCSLLEAVVGSNGRSQWWGPAYIFSQVTCPCPQSGTETSLCSSTGEGGIVADSYKAIKALHYYSLATICQYNPMCDSVRLCSSLIYLERVALGFGILLLFFAASVFCICRETLCRNVSIFSEKIKADLFQEQKNLLEFVACLRTSLHFRNITTDTVWILLLIQYIH